jgi:hypothetical protein
MRRLAPVGPQALPRAAPPDSPGSRRQRAGPSCGLPGQALPSISVNLGGSIPRVATGSFRTSLESPAIDRPGIAAGGKALSTNWQFTGPPTRPTVLPGHRTTEETGSWAAARLGVFSR